MYVYINSNYIHYIPSASGANWVSIRATEMYNILNKLIKKYINPSIDQSINQQINQSVNQSINH